MGRVIGAVAIRLFAYICLLPLGTPAFAQKVALTFDDLPAHGPLPPGLTRIDVVNSIINSLQDARVPRVYGFINARKLEQHPEDIEVLKLWRNAAFPLGNHTYSHLSLNDTSIEKFEQDTAANEPVLQSLMPTQNWRWFRYPFLWEGDTIEKRQAIRGYLKDHHYRIAQVTLDFEDYAWNPPYARCAEKNDRNSIEWLKSSYIHVASEYISVGRQMAKLVYSRDVKHVFLLHLGGFQTVMLPQLINLLKSQGFKFITLEEAEKDPAYKSDPNLPLRDGGTLLEQMMEAKHLTLSPHTDKPLKELDSVCR